MKQAVLGVLLSFFVLAGVLAEPVATDQIREIRSLRRGELVYIRGTVLEYGDYDELMLGDETGRIEVYLGERVPREPVADVGETVLVYGRADDDALLRPREIYAFEITRRDGSVIRLDNR